MSEIKLQIVPDSPLAVFAGKTVKLGDVIETLVGYQREEFRARNPDRRRALNRAHRERVTNGTARKYTKRGMRSCL